MITKGQKINNRYEIIKSIGEGGMANVYLAKDTILDRKVAIKILRGDLANDEKFIRRFQREALAASSLSHDNIVEMYDVGEDNGNYYIVMEYVEGKTLKQHMKHRPTGRLTITEAVDVMLQLTQGLAHAHDSYIIHRDIKPQNIMIKDDGRIKITDFGIAMALNSTQLTQTNSVMGSVHYLPPEQANGKTATIKSDIYSAGILFYELLTGILPFKGENAVEIALKHMREAIPSVRKQNPEIPQSIENIILKATAKNPKNRYNDIKEMHEDLLNALKEENQDVEKYTYPYLEHEQEEKPLPTIKPKQEKIKQEKEEKLTDTKEIVKEIKKEEKSSPASIVIWILSGIFFLIVAIMGIFIFVIPELTKVPNITVPDVKGLTVVEAEKILQEKGFEVKAETEKIASETIEQGLVVKTSPAIGRSIKKGKTITIYESTGNETYIIEDYTDKNYIQIKTLLEEKYGLKVTIAKKEIEYTDDIDEQKILDQSLEKGTKVTPGDKIILYIPDVYENYPDFAKEGWTLQDIEKFCEKYKITLIIQEEETSSYSEGTVIRQSRTGKIVTGVTLKITIAKQPTIVDPTPEEPEEEN